jgi:hypothetical protein
MASINKYFDLLTLPAQSEDSIGVQAVMGLIALVVLVWAVRGLFQWKVIDASRKKRYIFITVVAGVVLGSAVWKAYISTQGYIHIPVKKYEVTASSFSYVVNHESITAAGFEQPVAGCATTTSNTNKQSVISKK